MGAAGFLTRTRRQNKREKSRYFAVSWFTITLIFLGFFFWYYYVFTMTIGIPRCQFAAHWVAGWFDYNAPLQLFAGAFLVSGILWFIRLFSVRHGESVAEFILQGVFIAGFLVSLGFVKAMIFPYGTPSFNQASYVADKISPIRLHLEEDPEVLEYEKPPWPYDFPRPPSYPYWRTWMEGYNPELKEIFTSKNSPTVGEYSAMLKCVAIFQTRNKERMRAEQEFYEWYHEYAWRVDKKYLGYAWN